MERDIAAPRAAQDELAAGGPVTKKKPKSRAPAASPVIQAVRLDAASAGAWSGALCPSSSWARSAARPLLTAASGTSTIHSSPSISTRCGMRRAVRTRAHSFASLALRVARIAVSIAR